MFNDVCIKSDLYLYLNFQFSQIRALKLVEGYVAEVDVCVCMFVHVCRLISRIRNRLHSLFPFTQQGASAMTSKVSEMQVRCLNNLAAAQLKARGACARECHDTSRVLSSLSLTLLTSLPPPPPPPLNSLRWRCTKSLRRLVRKYSRKTQTT